MFNTELFEEHLATSWLGRSFYFFEELPSSNSHAKKMKDGNPLHGTLILAEHQTGGRGQYDRKWKVSPGKNLTFSMIFEPQKAERFTLLTLACALAVSEAINELTGISVSLKWPNDILHDGKKLCGILTETQFSGNNLERVVVGIGLNVNQSDFGQELSGKASSLILESENLEEPYSREKLLAEILQNTEYRYRQWNEFDLRLVKEINNKMAGFGKWTNLLVNDEELEGEYKFLGVNEAGSFVALNQDLDVCTFSYEQVRVQY